MRYNRALPVIFILCVFAFSTSCSCRPKEDTMPTASPAENQTAGTSPHDVAATQPSDYSGSLISAGLQRTYTVHLPAAYTKSLSWPLVIILHGGGGEGKQMDALTGFNAEADVAGFIAVYPDAVEHNWNDGRGNPGIRSQALGIDDVSFISSLIDRLENDLNINKKMIYVTGISNGAMMSHRLGSELSAKIAAIAPVAGNVPEKMKPDWSPVRPLSVLIINGTDDPLVPFNGGEVTFFSLKRGRVVSVSETVKFWVANSGCAAVPGVYQLPDIDREDGTTTTVESYNICSEGVEIILYTVKGGGHTWPGGLQYLNESLIGRTSRDFKATATIWQFFKKHPMK